MKANKIYLLLLFSILVVSNSCTNVNDTYQMPVIAEKSVIYAEPFASSLGLFTAKSALGKENWAFNSNGYAMVTGYVSSTNNANDAWLISSTIDLTNVTSAHFTIDHVARYFGNSAAEATIWVSENYNSTDSLPASATWTQLNNKAFIDPGTWPSPLPTSDQISLTAFAGKKIKVAFRYLSSTAKAGTWELKNFIVKSGEAVNIPGNTGLSSAPYKVSEALSVNGVSKYVKGYVVGYSINNVNYYSADTCTQVTNLLIADTTSAIYSARCLVVQLPAGIGRDSLNLKDNKARLFGKKIIVYGLLGLTANGTEMSEPTYFILPNSNTGGIKPIEPVLSETFEKSLGDFTTQSVVGAEIWGVSFKAATMTGYVKPNNLANEDWLISPEIDLTSVSTAKLTFDHVIRYCTNPVTDATLWVSENYTTGAPSTATWTQLTTSVFADPNSWTFSTIGPISLADYSGKKIKFAFKYVSTTTKAGTWEIKNVLILR
jgi:hypothetical protein